MLEICFRSVCRTDDRGAQECFSTTYPGTAAQVPEQSTWLFIRSEFRNRVSGLGQFGTVSGRTIRARIRGKTLVVRRTGGISAEPSSGVACDFPTSGGQ